MRKSNTLLVLVVLVALCCSLAVATAAADETRKLVSAVYVFGDSLVDVGNNNYLPAPAPRANSPYGMDLPGNPTGRFTNGYNLADVISQRLGFKMSPPAYKSMRPRDWDHLFSCKIGANYASGGSGILNTTGKGTLTMWTQIQYFNATTRQMRRCSPSKQYLLSQSLFLLSAGGNDFSAFNSSINDAPAYIAKMVSTYIEHVQALYKLGARMVGILDVPPIGCTPGSRADVPTGGCNDVANALARWFNSLLRMELAGLAYYMPELKYSIASNYNILTDMIANPFVAGLKEVQKACCGAGRFMAKTMCGQPNTTACVGHHDEYMFWDMLHGTQATYERGVMAFFYGDAPKYAEPINFSTLVAKKGIPAPKHQLFADE